MLSTRIVLGGLVASAFCALAAPAVADCGTTAGHDFMGRLATVAGERWAATTLSGLLLPGSHDAGTYGNATGPGPASWAQTQTHTFLGQLCRGARWFDVRLKKDGDGWRVFHGPFLFGSGQDVLRDLLTFVNDKKHKYEVVFVRLKLDGSVQEIEDLYKSWFEALGKRLIARGQYPQKTLATMTMRDLRSVNTATGGHVVLINYDKKKKKGRLEKAGEKLSGKEKPAKLPKQAQVSLDVRSRTWSYVSHQAGEFSNKVPLREVISGQRAMLKAWKDGGAQKVYGLWWTSTGAVGALDVRKNTKKLWPKEAKSPNSPLEAFVKRSGCRIGSFLIVDFYGDNTVTRTDRNVIRDLAYRISASKIKQPLRIPAPCR